MSRLSSEYLHETLFHPFSEHEMSLAQLQTDELLAKVTRRTLREATRGSL